MAIALSLFVCLASRQGAQEALQKPLDFQTVAVPMSKALDALSQKSGVRLLAAPTCSFETVLIDVKGVTLNELMKRLAVTADADWAKEGDGFRLVRESDRVHAEELEQRRQVLESFKAAIAKKAKLAADLKPFGVTDAKSIIGQIQKLQTAMTENDNGNSWMKMQQLEQSAPAGRAITRIVSAFTPDELASIPAEWRTVYSTNPTPMQRQMPASVAKAIDGYVKDQNAWAEAMEQSFSDQDQQAFYADSMMQKQRIARPVAKVLIAFTRYAVAYGCQVDMIVADDKNQVLGRASGNVDQWWEDATPPTAPPKADETNFKFALSALAKKVQVVSQNEQIREVDRKPIDPEVIDFVQNPEKQDPLSLAPSECLMQAAEALKENVVAILPDSLSSISDMVANEGQLSPKAFIDTLDKSYQVTIEQKDGWLTCYPKERLMDRKTQVDRRALGAFARAMNSKKRRSLDDLCAYALASPAHEMDPFAEFAYSVLVPAHRNPMFGDDGDWDMYKFYGSMSAEQRVAVTKGQPISLGGLNAVQIAALKHMVFGSWPRLNGGMIEMAAPVADGAPLPDSNNLESEPTEALPNGILASGSLTVNNRNEEVLMAVLDDPNNYNGSRDMTEDEVTFYMFGYQRLDIFPWMSDARQAVSFDHVRLGARKGMDFTFTFKPKTTMQATLNDVDYGSGPPIPFAQLPEAYRKKIDAKMEELKKQYKDVKPGQYQGFPPGGRTIPPG